MLVREKVKYRTAKAIKLLIQHKSRKCVIQKDAAFIHLWDLSEYDLLEGRDYLSFRGDTTSKSGKRVKTIVYIPIIRD